MNIGIHSVGYNSEPLRNTHVIGRAGVGLYVCGLKQSKERYPDGRIRTRDVSARLPSLRLYFPGGVSEYEYDNIRENWWVTFADPVPIHYDSELNKPLFHIGEKMIPIKAEIHLESTEVSSLRMAFSEIRAGWLQGTPLGKATAELILAGIMSRFLKTELQMPQTSLADRFRALIDSDTRWTHSLEELSKQLSIHRDYARELFQKRFGVTPGVYRIQRRLACIMELITSTDLSAKEIAWQCGLRNVTYLNALTRRHFNATPSELIRRFRLGI